MLEKLRAVENRYDELCARSEQPDFYADPQKAARLLREKNELEPIIGVYRAYQAAEREMGDAHELMAEPDMLTTTSGLPVFFSSRNSSCCTGGSRKVVRSPLSKPA